MENLETKTIDELKVIAYDLIAASQQINNQLQAVNNLIQKKLNEVQPIENGTK
ncbi:MAG: hypothetical protein IM600_18775 [Bacteroidetes bacterium]|nr:hypothetical protein [Bacteroidota bacterium]